MPPIRISDSVATEGAQVGTEALWIPAVLAAAGGAAQAVNTRNVAKRQDNQAAAGIRQQAETQRGINARINQTLQQTAAANPDEVRSTVQDQYLRQAQAKLGQARAGLVGDTGLSSAYNEAANTAGGKVADFATSTAGLLARMDAPGVQRQQEGMRFGNLGMDLDAVRGNVQADQFLNQLRMQGIRRNPWLDAAGAALSGAGAGMASRAGSTGGYGAGYSAANTGTIAPVAYQSQYPWALPRYAGG